MLPYKLTRHYPLTIIIASGLVGLHFDMFDKPWSTKWFWSSGPSLVCINHHYVYNKLDFKRLLSGPLEHSSNVHFFICLTSLVFKLSMLEKTYGVIKTLALSLISFFGTSVNYVLIIQALFNEQTCVQGLSGTNFALKVFVLLSTFSLPIPILCFELAETLVLIEKRTFYWHFSGLCLSGVCLLLYMTFLKPSKFPGRGQVLLETKSWGYVKNGKSRFTRLIKSPSPASHSPRSSVGSSCWSRSEDESGSSPESSGHRSQRSATLSPEPRSFAHRPPPPILGNGILLRESQSPNDELQYDNEL